MSLANPSANTRTNARRYDLDWLRVIAFGVLIFYHIGMFYVTWDWHVKSPHASTAPEFAMMLVNPWRLALLFLISGIALRHVTDKGALASFSGRRTLRLILPILFGMAVVVAPQSYYQLRQAGVIEAGFGAFYADYLSFDAGVMERWQLIVPTWNHLWYVVYLLVYTWIVILLIKPLRALSRQADRLPAKAWPLILVVPALPFVLYRFTLVPYFETTHDLVWDWANHANSLTVLLLGFLLAKNEGFWRAVRLALPVTLVLVVLCTFAFSHFWQETVLLGLLENNPSMLAAIQSLRVLYAWWVILAILGLGQRFLDRDSPARRYMSDMIFAWYILHQTITVAAGYYLAKIALPAGLEFALLSAATILGCLAGAEAIRRSVILRPFFGMRLAGHAPIATARGGDARQSAREAPASSSAS
ncbi:acyltransferase family protein [Aquisalinus flavus]|uniref:Acyltransferase n=1 Tax=Aquisalinus flavus TaxID=1526572 RepID=A0A8J2V2L2_9PROT|nr:acyltransferase family protein [Aquisalinus flavus]MBD0427536.1 acyltransferase family protein [Aquisalinus flavus]UNE47329.1 acyltransferase family protein [Aquisalinus flavus]GGD01739.1 acyltransferase [Aquisalinus flavus]